MTARTNEASTLPSIETYELQTVSGGWGRWGMVRAYERAALVAAAVNGYPPPPPPYYYYRRYYRYGY